MSGRRAAIGSALFLLVAPGTVAGLVPWLLTGWESRSWPWPVRAAGRASARGGGGGAAERVRPLRPGGIGTPAPVAPTQRLVVGGLYRHVRNPMYVAVVARCSARACCWDGRCCSSTRSRLWAVFAAFVRVYEEPVLLDTYGEDYERFRAAVPAWLPRLRPWRGG